MAVAWPDFSLATITETKYYDALKAAVAERCAAACAGAGHAFFFPASDQWCDATPDLNRLKELRNAIRSLAPAFVNFENEGYQWQAWSRFPIAYTAADVMGGEHSLAILPTPGSPESNAELLSVYRTNRTPSYCRSTGPSLRTAPGGSSASATSMYQDNPTTHGRAKRTAATTGRSTPTAKSARAATSPRR